MAKKKTTIPPAPAQLFETETPTSRKVKNAAARYKQASVTKAQATADYNAKRDALIDLMIEENCERVVVESEGVRKALVLFHSDTLKETAIKEPKGIDE